MEIGCDLVSLNDNDAIVLSINLTDGHRSLEGSLECDVSKCPRRKTN